MVRAFVLIGLSAALGAWLTPLLLGARLPAPVVSRLRRGADALLLLAIAFDIVQIHAHGEMLLAGSDGSTVSSPFEASTQTHVGLLLWTEAAAMLLAWLLRRVGARKLPVALLLVGLAVDALSGHVAASGESAVLSAVALLHVVLVGLWFGGLPALWMLWRYGSPGDSLALRTLAAFSRFALPAMLLILASGVLLARETVGRWAALVATPYGWLLLAKLALLTLALVCAFALRRGLARATCQRPGGVPDAQKRWLAREALLACGVVLAAGTLAGSVPAAHDPISWPFGFRIAPRAAWLQRQAQIRWPLGGAAGLVVLGVGAGAALWQRRRRLAIVAGCGAVACGIAVAVPALAVNAYPSTYAASNAPYDVTSVVGGARLYGALCAQCHGVRGQGDGPLAARLNPPPADLTAPHVGWHTHGDMYWWITKGFEGSAMPAFEGRTTDVERWQIVNYLMAISLGYQSRGLSDRPVPDDPWLAAINFRYPTPSGGFAQLSELQSQSAVLLVFIADAAELPRLHELSRQAPRWAAGGLKIIAVLGPGLEAARAVPDGVEVVHDADGEICAAWSNYRRTLAQPDFRDESPRPARMEMLVDRSGYVRARWRADEGAGAPGPDALRLALETLSREPAFPPADVHAH